MEAGVHASPAGRLEGASLAVIMEWSERELYLLATVSQHQQSSAGTAIPSSLVLDVGELCVFSVPSRTSELCKLKRDWSSAAM
eukprot:11979330-Heterocapsa_arctica.AAC.1